MEHEVAEQPKSETALAPVPPQTIDRQNIGIIPKTFEDGWRFSKLIASSDLAPKDYRDKPANVLVAIQMGAELGLSPMAALQNIAVINGRPSLWGDAALAVVQVHPGYVTHKEYFEGTGDSKTAVFEITRKGHDLHVTKFSIADAKKAGLWDKKPSPWQTYPDRMLQMRARGFGLRDKFADALRGLSIAEEAIDLPPVIAEAQFVPDTKLADKSKDRLNDAVQRATAPTDEAEQRKQAEAHNENLLRRRAAEGITDQAPKKQPTSPAEQVPEAVHPPSGDQEKAPGVQLGFDEGKV